MSKIVGSPFVRPNKVTDEMVMSCKEYLASNRRTIFLDDQIVAPSTNVTTTLMALDSISNKPIVMVLYCPGGSVDAGFAICDIMNSVKSKIITIAMSIQSMAVPIFMSGDKRYVFPHARTMLHLPFGMIGGDTRTVNLANKEMQRVKDKMIDYLIEKGIKGTKKQVEKDIDRELWIEPEDTVKKGIADSIITPKQYRSLIGGTSGKEEKQK